MSEAKTPEKAPYVALIRDLPASERPRERLRDHGSEHLTTSELLAITLRTGQASESVLNLSTRLLTKYGGLLGLHKASFLDLCREKGIGPAKAAQLKAAIEIGRRLQVTEGDAKPMIRDPKDVSNLLQTEMAILDHEQLRVMLLNTKNHVLGIRLVYKGNVNSAQVRVSEVYKDAIKENCPSIIVVHNHPSGDPTPSEDDVALTGNLYEAGRLLDIELLDHIVIGHDKFVSMKSKGLGFKSH